jgi:flavodoxin
MPKALVLYASGQGASEEIARAIYGGASETGLETNLASAALAPTVADYDLVFLGSGIYGFGRFDSKVLALARQANWQGKRACVFATHGGRGKAHVEAVAAELEGRGARLCGTLSIQLPGLAAMIGKGKPSETDMVRAFAFGEKQAYDLIGRRPAKDQEKSRIKGYRK